MAKKKFDVVVEAVHYNAEGQVEWVRVFQRRGPTFSDRIILDRPALIDLLKRGKVFYTGKRVPLMASTFEIDRPVSLKQDHGRDLVVTGETSSDQDFLEGVPII